MKNKNEKIFLKIAEELKKHNPKKIAVLVHTHWVKKLLIVI